MQFIRDKVRQLTGEPNLTIRVVFATIEDGIDKVQDVEGEPSPDEAADEKIKQLVIKPLKFDQVIHLSLLSGHCLPNSGTDWRLSINHV